MANEKSFKDTTGDRIKISRERKIDKSIYISHSMGYYEYDLDTAKQMAEHLMTLIKQQDPFYAPVIKNVNINFDGEWV